MRAISLWQPWASLLAAGGKRVETRSWALPGPFPRVLAVHAAKKWDGALAKLCRTEPFASALARAGFPVAPHGLPFGALVGVVRVARVWPTFAVRYGAMDHEGPVHCVSQAGAETLYLTGKEMAFGDYSPGRFAWVCDQFHAFPEPVPCRGFQGIFNVDLPEGLGLPEWAGVAQRSVS